VGIRQLGERLITVAKTKREARLAAAREALAAQRRAEARRKRLRNAGIAVGTVLVVVAVLVVVKLTASPAKSTPTTSAAADVVQKVTTVPAATFDTVGKGTVSNPPVPISGQPALTADGKPLVLYVGGEFCPYCAAERWALVSALSRFGTFANLKQAASSPTDVFPNTQTLSFFGSSYTSDLISFQGVEAEDVDQKPLQQLTPEQQANFTKYDAPPYTSSDARGSFPFVNFGNIALQIGASYDPTVLAGKSGTDIAAALHDPNSAIAKGAIGSANAFTAAICAMTGNKPADVCNSPGVAAYAGKYGG